MLKVSDILQFIFSEMQKAIEEKSKERMLELGTAADVFFEAAKNKDHKVEEILRKFDYVVFHYEDEFSFAEEHMRELRQMIAEIESR